jgi:hypothetical protein
MLERTWDIVIVGAGTWATAFSRPDLHREDTGYLRFCLHFTRLRRSSICTAYSRCESLSTETQSVPMRTAELSADYHVTVANSLTLGAIFPGSRERVTPSRALAMPTPTPCQNGRLSMLK